MLTWIVVFWINTGMVVLGGYLAYRDKMFTVRQMVNYRSQVGIPFIAHLGMWGDLLIIGPLLATFIAKYAGRWSGEQVCWALAIGIVVSGAMHASYLLIETPEAHVQHHRLTPAGWVHCVYMTWAITVLVLFYFFTAPFNHGLIIATSLLVCLHLVLGTHLILDALGRIFGWPWYVDLPWKNPATWFALLTAGGLVFFRSMILLGR